MRSLALALVASVLGTGCIIHSDDDTTYVPPPGPVGDAIVYWEFIRNAPAQTGGFVTYDASLTGTRTGSCPQSSVEAVRVNSAAGQVDVNCQEWNAAEGASIQGIVVGNLAEGSQSIRVRGYRGAYVVYDSTVSVNVVGNTQVPVYVSTEAVMADVELYAYLAYGNPITDYPTCGDAGNPNISYALYDSFGTLVDDGLVGCSNPLPAFVYGAPLDLDNYTVRMQGFTTSPTVPVFDSCGIGFDHFGTQIGVDGIPVDLLTLPVPTCN